MKRKFEITYHPEAFVAFDDSLPVEFECDMVLYPHQCGGVYTFNDKRPGVDSDSMIGPAYDAKLVLSGDIVAMVRDVTPVNEAPSREEVLEFVAKAGLLKPSPEKDEGCLRYGGQAYDSHPMVGGMPEMPPHMKRPQLWNTEGENSIVPSDAERVYFVFENGTLVGSSVDERVAQNWRDNENYSVKTLYISF